MGSFVPLMVHHEVTSIPSASTLAVLRRELQGRAPAEKVVLSSRTPCSTRLMKGLLEA